MKKITKIFFLLLILISVNTTAQTKGLTETSVTEPIEYLKQLIVKNESINFKVQIINRHNGEYRINSIIELDNDQVLIKSRINDMTNSTSDIKLNFDKAEFIGHLEDLLTQTDRFFILAGHYQNIQIKQNNNISEYFTRNAHALMHLLDGRVSKTDEK